MESNDEVTIVDLESKCKSKKELYNLLIREGHLYHPPSQDANQKYLRSLMIGNKKCLKCEDVKVTKIPQYEGLRVKKYIKISKSKVDINMYISNYDYTKEPNRECLCDVVTVKAFVETPKMINNSIIFRGVTTKTIKCL